MHSSDRMCSYLDDFSEQYRGVHGYLSLVVCLLGTVLNLLNIAVLTRKGRYTYDVWKLLGFFDPSPLCPKFMYRVGGVDVAQETEREALEGLRVSPKPAASRKINKRIISHPVTESWNHKRAKFQEFCPEI